MNKIPYLQNLESEYYSVLVCQQVEGEFLKYLNTKKLTRVYESSIMEKTGSITFNKVVFQSQQNFYLYIENNNLPNVGPRYGLTIYYKSEQYSELYLFVTQLLKQYKNDTINNTTIKR